VVQTAGQRSKKISITKELTAPSKHNRLQDQRDSVAMQNADGIVPDNCHWQVFDSHRQSNSPPNKMI
jgi:hypothetical protein